MEGHYPGTGTHHMCVVSWIGSEGAENQSSNDRQVNGKDENSWGWAGRTTAENVSRISCI